MTRAVTLTTPTRVSVNDPARLARALGVEAAELPDLIESRLTATELVNAARLIGRPLSELLVSI